MFSVAAFLLRVVILDTHIALVGIATIQAE